MIWTFNKCNKKMGSPCLFTRQQALKMGYFYWLRVKNSNHLHTELSLGYLKDTKFYFENKASFIYISSIKIVPWLAWSPRLGQNTPSTEMFSKKIHVLLSNFFSSSNMFFIRLFLANTLGWGKSLAFCTRTCSCARANDARIVRSRDAQAILRNYLKSGVQ